MGSFFGPETVHGRKQGEQAGGKLVLPCLQKKEEAWSEGRGRPCPKTIEGPQCTPAGAQSCCEPGRLWGSVPPSGPDAAHGYPWLAPLSVRCPRVGPFDFIEFFG